MKKIAIIFVSLTATIAIALPALAAGIVPECTNTICTLCDGWHLASNIMNFLLVDMAIPVLIIMFIWGGVLWVSAGASSKNIEQGKNIITSALIGVLIAFAGWLIVDTIIKSLASGGQVIGAWQDFPTCKLAEPVNAPLPSGEGGATGNTGASSQSGQCGSADVCSPKAITCTTGSCAQYSGYATQYANSNASAELLKSIIMNESSCNVTARSAAGACGLTQLLPATANMYKNQCGVTDTIDCDWLTSHAKEDICITAAYISALARGTCGSDVRNIAAGYNGGGGACQQSSSCSGDTLSCERAVRKWECLYDNPEKTQCNTGYVETRNYAAKVLYCASSPGF